MCIRDRIRSLEKLRGVEATLIFFETANRISDVLTDMIEIFDDRDAVLARELTKTFEEIRRGDLRILLESTQQNPPRGEIVLMIGPPNTPVRWDQASIDAAITQSLPDMGVKQASQYVAELSGWSKRDVYQRALAIKEQR